MATLLPRYDGDVDRLTREALAYVCPRCGETGISFHGPGEGPHYAAWECDHCGSHLGWAQKPDTPQTRRRSRLPAKLDEDRCCICGGTRAELAALGVQLQAHHLTDRAMLVDAGVDPDDLKHLAWICGDDHQVVTAQRRRFATFRRLLNAFTAVEGDPTGIERPPR
jgi:hypothetical protein